MAYADALNAQPALVANERSLREKITILCLLQIVFQLPADNRQARPAPPAVLLSTFRISGSQHGYSLWDELGWFHSGKTALRLGGFIDKAAQLGWFQERHNG